MTEPEVSVFITDIEFTLTELKEFIEKARTVDGIPHNCLVVIERTLDSPPYYTLRASSAFRSK